MSFSKMVRWQWLIAGVVGGTALVILLGVWVQRFSAASIADRLEQYGPAARARLKPYFEKAGIAYPPKNIVLVGLKKERLFEVWVSGDGKQFKLLRTYPILGASGVLGPKLREGDRQVPEGLYRVELLNPNSSYHLSLRVNYPNEFDLQQAKAEGRTQPGSDIMIHGRNVSIGCVAIGDPAIEEVFVLAAETGIKQVEIILAPVDFRKQAMPEQRKPLPAWTNELYAEINRRLVMLK